MLHREATFLRKVKVAGEVSRRVILHERSWTAGFFRKSIIEDPVPAACFRQKVKKRGESVLIPLPLLGGKVKKVSDMQSRSISKKVCHALWQALRCIFPSRMLKKLHIGVEHAQSLSS